jgi:hypothetical protein
MVRQWLSFDVKQQAAQWVWDMIYKRCPVTSSVVMVTKVRYYYSHGVRHLELDYWWAVRISYRLLHLLNVFPTKILCAFLVSLISVSCAVLCIILEFTIFRY